MTKCKCTTVHELNAYGRLLRICSLLAVAAWKRAAWKSCEISPFAEMFCLVCPDPDERWGGGTGVLGMILWLEQQHSRRGFQGCRGWRSFEATLLQTRSAWSVVIYRWTARDLCVKHRSAAFSCELPIIAALCSLHMTEDIIAVAPASSSSSSSVHPHYWVDIAG